MIPGNKKDNFWEMGDTGPCGPCSELHYDGRVTEEQASTHTKPTDSICGTPGHQLVNADHPEVIEIWNLVFIQYNRNQDGSLSPLPAKHVDTGMGFERIVRVIQNKDSNYDTDVFTPLFKQIEAITGARAYTPGGHKEALQDPINIAYRVIADHIRTLVFALSDGGHCGNEGRNYVLRSILRRAVRFGKQTLGMDDPFFYKLVPTVIEHFGDTFPEIRAKQNEVAKEIQEEEESFRKTLDRGTGLLHKVAIERIAANVRGLISRGGPTGTRDGGGNLNIALDSTATILVKDESGTKVQLVIPATPELQKVFVQKYCFEVPCIDGATAFKLHDTYGFPIGLTQLMAEERGLAVDIEGFEREMEKARERSRSGGSGVTDVKSLLTEWVQQNETPPTEFVGNEHTQAKTTVLHVIELPKGEAVVLDRTPFYAEQGGQVGDTGQIRFGPTRFSVNDTFQIGGVYFQVGQSGDSIVWSSAMEGESVEVELNGPRRNRITSNHTTTHVMNRALRDHVSQDANQKGSLVDDEKTRFDFSHNAPLTLDELNAVEKQVNDDIAADLPVYTGVASQEKAIKINGLRAVFGEKYPPEVRIVSIGAPVEDLLSDPDNERWATLSIEFCGGTHLKKTGDAEGFVIVSEEGVAKGVRRITAITGAAAHKAQATGEQLLARLEAVQGNEEADTLNATVSDIAAAMEAKTLPAIAKHKLRDGLKRVQDTLKKLDKAQQKQSAGAAVEVARKLAEELTGPVIVADLGTCDAAAIQSPMDVMRKKHPEAAVLLIGAAGDKVALMATVPKPLIEQGLKAGDWIKHVAPIVGGGGGGRPDSARAGGKDTTKIGEAVEAAKSFAAEKTG